MASISNPFRKRLEPEDWLFIVAIGVWLVSAIAIVCTAVHFIRKFW